MRPYKTCPYCGSNLEYGERCACEGEIIMDTVTAEDCAEAYRYRGLAAVLRDGRVQRFEKEATQEGKRTDT